MSGQINIRQSLKKAYRKQRPTRAEIELLRRELVKMLDEANPKESGEYHKGLLKDFLKKSAYANYFINTKDRRTANITWNKSKDAVGFVIRYGITPEKLYNQYQVMGKTELKINSLNRDVGYYFSIDVFNENGYTKGTNIIESK